MPKNSDQENPYAPPQVDALDQSDPGLGSENVLCGLKPRSVILMILLTVVTLGLYMNFWFHRSAIALNKRLDRNRISMIQVGAFWVLSLSSVLWTIPEILAEEGSVTVDIGTFLTNADMIFALVCAFTIRGRLNLLIQVPRSHPAWSNAFWTFIFGILYLQWKINKNLRLPRLPVRQSSSTAAPSFEFLHGMGGEERGV